MATHVRVLAILHIALGGFGLVLARHLLRAGARVLVIGRSSAGVREALEACNRAGVPIAGPTSRVGLRWRCGWRPV